MKNLLCLSAALMLSAFGVGCSDKSQDSACEDADEDTCEDTAADTGEDTNVGDGTGGEDND